MDHCHLDLRRRLARGCGHALAALMAALVLSLCACGSDDEDSPPPPLPPVAVLSAFPAELAPLVERASIRQTTTIEGRVFRLGELGGVPVVLGLTGIGLVNAGSTTRILLENFQVRGIVVSGVAGTSLRIGDVTVARSWALADGSTYAADAAWLALVAELASGRRALFETCTVRPMAPADAPVCLAHVPAVVVGGTGESTDSFGNRAFQCAAGAGDVFGCDVTDATVADLIAVEMASTLEGIDPSTITVADMETAAIAREATQRGVPFIAFRSTSDGSGDPLDLPGFPAQFFVYYRLAAYNAAAATIAFLESL